MGSAALTAARAVATALTLTLACAAFPARAATPSAAEVRDARQHFQRGVKFYQDGDFRSALVEFQEAYRISPNYRLLFNIGQTFEELGDFAGALRALRDYKAEGGGELTKARRAEVEKDLARLEGHVARLEVTVSEADADVSADGERRVDLGKSPIARAVLLNGGDWTIRARKAGFDAAEARVTVAGGDEKRVSLTLVPVAPPAAAPPAALPAPVASDAPAPLAPMPSPPPASRTAAWVSLAVAGTLGAATGVAGFVALGQKSKLDATLDRFGATNDEIASARSKMRTWALTTDVLGGATLVAAAVTVVLFVIRPPERRSARGTLAPYVGACGPGGAGACGAVGASGTFD